MSRSADLLRRSGSERSTEQSARMNAVNGDGHDLGGVCAYLGAKCTRRQTPDLQDANLPLRRSIPIFPASHLSGSRINSRNAGRARAGAGARAAA